MRVLWHRLALQAPIKAAGRSRTGGGDGGRGLGSGGLGPAWRVGKRGRDRSGGRMGREERGRLPAAIHTTKNVPSLKMGWPARRLSTDSAA